MKHSSRPGLIFSIYIAVLFWAIFPTIASAQSWVSIDINLPESQAPGSTTSLSSDIHDVVAGGTGIGSTSDSFRLVSQLVTGNIEVEAQLLEMEGDSNSSEAGLMIRQGSGAATAFASVTMDASRELRFRWRSLGAVASAFSLGTTVPEGVDVWFKLARTGSACAGYYSIDGINWLLVGSAAISLSNSFEAGLMACSGSDEDTVEVSFERAVVTTNVPQRQMGTTQSGAAIRLWLRADSNVVYDEAGRISKWEDFSGYANDAFAIGGVGASTQNRPLLAHDSIGFKRGVRFDNDSLPSLAERKYLKVNDHGTLNPQRTSVFMVAKWEADPVPKLAGLLSKGGSAAGYTLGFDTAVPRVSISGTVEKWAAKLTPGQPYLMEAIFDQIGVRLFVNGQMALVPTPRTAVITTNSYPLFIGQYLSAPTVANPTATQVYPFTGDIAEVIVFNDTVTENKRRELEVYFKSKYQIPALPAPKVEVPTINAVAGIYASAQTVSITVPDGAAVYYRVNGGDAQLYTGPITLPDGTTSLTVWAEKTGHLNSDEVTTPIVIDANTGYVDRSGLQLWLRADTGVSLAAGGNDVVQWRSQVPPYFIANAGTGNRPALRASGTAPDNRASIEFLNDWLRITTPPTGSPLAVNHHSICVVAKVSNATPASPGGIYSALLSRLGSQHGYYVGLKATQPTGSPLQLQMRSRLVYSSVGEDVITPIVAPPASPFLSTGVWNAQIATFNQTNMVLRINREQRAIKARTTQVGDAGNPYLLIGAYSAAATPSQPFQGDIAEILIYDRELTPKQVRELEAYLQDRYQLSHAVTPSADLQATQKPGLYPSPPQIGFTSTDAATITYTVNGHGSSGEGGPLEPISYSSPFTPKLEHAVALAGGVDRYTIVATATKSGFASATKTFTYYVDPRTGDVPRSGLKLWLRADLGLATQPATSPPQITRWLDQSGWANHLKTADGVVKPHRLTTTSVGRPAVSFGATGLSQMLPESNNFSLGTGANNDITVLAIVKDNGSSDNAVVVEQETVNNTLGFSLRYRTETGGKSMESKFNSSTIKATQPPPPASPPLFIMPAGFNLVVQRGLGTDPIAASSHVLGINRSGTKSVNNFAKITDDAAQLFSLGARRVAQVQDPLNSATMPINGLNGEIAELLVFDGFLSDLEIQRLEAYLAYRYSLSTDSRVPLPTLADASISPSSGTWVPGTEVEITHSESNVTLSYRYVIGTSIPTETPWLPYGNPIVLTAPGAYILEVKREKPGYQTSIQSVRLTIDPVVQGLPRDDLALWLAADRGLTTTLVSGVQQVDEWRDESGNGYKAVPVASTRKPTVIDSPIIKYNLLDSESQPIASKVILFPNVDRRLQVLNAAKLASAQMTVFVVSRSRNSVNTHTLLQRQAANPMSPPSSGWSLSYLGVTGDGADTYLNSVLFGPLNDPSLLWINISNNNSVPNRANDLQPSLITGVVGSSLRVLPNLDRTGEAVYTGSWSQDVSALGDDLYIGGTSSATLLLNGEIAEVLIYHRALGQSEVAKVQDYLVGRYSFGYKKPLAAPVISPNGGVFSTNTTVTITPPPGALLIYEEDGNGVLKTASTTVQIPMTVAPNNGVTNKTIKAWSTKAGYIESSKVYAAISIDPYADLVPQGQELALWVRGDSATVGSATPKIDRWLDLSGHGHHLTKPTPAAVGAPEKVVLTENVFNGWPVVRFSATAKTCMEGNYPGLDSQTVSVFAVIRGPKDTVATTRIIAEKYDSAAPVKGYSLRRTYNSGSRFNFLTNTTSFFADTDSAELPTMLVGGTHSASARKAYYQAVEKVSAAFTTQTLLTAASTPLRVGGINATYNFDGEIADLWIYSRDLTQAEIDMLGVYAHERYGVDSSKRVPAPTADYLGGTYSAPVGVALDCALPDATIRYVLGAAGQTTVADPDSNSPVFDPESFNSRIHVDGSFQILKAYASKAGYVDSEVSTWVFRVEPDKAVVRQGLVAWFNADRGIIDDVNDRVSRWTDQSGLGNDAVAPTPTGTQPFFDARPYEITVAGSNEENSFKSLRFNSAGNTLPLGLRIAHPKRFPDPSNPTFKTMSVAAVVRKLGTNDGLLFKKAGFELRQSTVSSVPRTTVRTNAAPSFIPVQQDKYEVIVGTYDQVRRTISNGNTVASAALTTALTEDLNPLYIGSNQIGIHATNFQGEIAELLIYNRGLSEAERKYTEGSLKSRYGLSNNAATFTLAPPKFAPGGSAATVELPEPCEIALLGPSGAAIYYTTDATVAATQSTATWSLYSEPVFISHHLDKIWAFSRIEGAQAVTSTVVSCQFLLDEEKFPPLQPQLGDETPPEITLEKPTHATLSTTP